MMFLFLLASERSREFFSAKVAYASSEPGKVHGT